MDEVNQGQVWTSGEGYEAYVGRWSRLVAGEFLDWLGVPPGSRWLDVGCGTGVLTRSILAACEPAAVQGIDRSPAFVEHARRVTTDPRASFTVAGADALPFADGDFQAVASGLVLNFLPDHGAALAEMSRVTTPGGVVSAYVWDYAGKMELMRYYWDAAAELDWLAESADEGARFSLCSSQAMLDAFQDAGLDDVEVRAIDAETVFADFDDFWTPFLSGQGPAPSYNMSLREEQRVELRELIRSRLPIASDGSISLIARAWAARGVRQVPGPRGTSG